MRERSHRAAIAVTALAAALGATVAVPPSPLLVWNASASTPVGLYAVASGRPAIGDWAIVRPPLAVRRLAAERHYLPLNVPLVKRVAATAGHHVCAAGERLTVDGRGAAVRHSLDGQGRSLPRWNGCRVLGTGELLVLGSAPDSFDGRYFGVLDETAVVGRAVPLWTR